MQIIMSVLWVLSETTLTQAKEEAELSGVLLCDIKKPAPWDGRDKQHASRNNSMGRDKQHAIGKDESASTTIVMNSCYEHDIHSNGVNNCQRGGRFMGLMMSHWSTGGRF